MLVTFGCSPEKLCGRGYLHMHRHSISHYTMSFFLMRFSSNKFHYWYAENISIQFVFYYNVAEIWVYYLEDYFQGNFMLLPSVL